MAKKEGMLIKLGALAVILFLAYSMVYGIPIKQAPQSASLVGAGGTAAVAAAACNLPSVQTLSVTAADHDVGSTLASPLYWVYKNKDTGELFGGNTTVNPNTKYDVYVSQSTAFADVVSIDTDCLPSPSLRVPLKVVDTPTVLTVNSNGVTPNTAVTSNQTLAASSGATIYVKMSQTAAYRHLSGPTNEFAVFVNATNLSSWDPSQMSASFDGKQCNDYTGATPTAVGGYILRGWVCNGDFLPNGGEQHTLAIKLQSSSTFATMTTGQSISVSYVGISRYINTQNNKVETGAVLNTGGAIQTMRHTPVWVN